MTDWEPLVAAGAVVLAAGLSALASKWNAPHRHSATKEALDILERLDGDRRDGWENVVQAHIDGEVRRAKGGLRFQTVGLLMLVGGYVLVALGIPNPSVLGGIMEGAGWVLMPFGLFLLGTGIALDEGWIRKASQKGLSKSP
jgi:hypothetical protein